jgi:hypothetical protein
MCSADPSPRQAARWSVPADLAQQLETLVSEVLHALDQRGDRPAGPVTLPYCGSLPDAAVASRVVLADAQESFGQVAQHWQELIAQLEALKRALAEEAGP